MHQFIPIQPKVVVGQPVKYESPGPIAIVDTGPRPLAVKEPTPILTLTAPRMDPYLEEMERRLGAS